MSTDQAVTIAAILLGIFIIVRIILRIIAGHMQYKQIQANMKKFKKDHVSNGNKDEHRNQRS